MDDNVVYCELGGDNKAQNGQATFHDGSASGSQFASGSQESSGSDRNPHNTTPDAQSGGRVLAQLSVPRKPQNTNDMFDVNRRLRTFWPEQKRKYERMDDNQIREHCRHMELPMARVKKIMKIDDDVKNQMISQDAPLFLAAASEMFIEELTLKSWQLVEEGRRKTLQKSDVASAVGRHEHYDFLIDIVPRDDRKFTATRDDSAQQHSTPALQNAVVVNSASGDSQVHYVLQDVDSMAQNGADIFQLDDGQVLQATPIGQPIPIAGPAGVASMQMPTGVQIVHVPHNAATSSSGMMTVVRAHNSVGGGATSMATATTRPSTSSA